MYPLTAVVHSLSCIFVCLCALVRHAYKWPSAAAAQHFFIMFQILNHLSRLEVVTNGLSGLTP